MNRRHALATAVSLFALRATAQNLNAPVADLAAVQGAWRGTLTYRDYSNPDRRVTLQTRLFVALLAPSELALHYIYNDGPGKTVHGYERMAFDFANATLVWTSGYPAAKTTQNRVTSSEARDGGRILTCEREEAGVLSRYLISLQSKSLVLSKEEGASAAELMFRNRYEFTRHDA